MGLGDDDSSDLLIFKLRQDNKDYEEAEEEPALVSKEPALKGDEAQETEQEAEVSPTGLKCATHPWRDAYAVCSKCGLAFCYVDIIKRGGKFICIEDIGKAEAEDLEKRVNSNNFFTGSGGALLAFNALALLYFFYPQVMVLYSELLSSLTAKGILLLFENYYYPSIANLAAVVFSLITGIAAITRGNRRWGIVAGFLIFMLISYEYMNSSGVNYLILSMALSFIAMIMFVLGNMSAVRAVDELVDEEYKQIDWPRPEAF